ncbi:MAG: hypothetical protein ACYC6N_12755 [Pirellulaceae bacterium]
MTWLELKKMIGPCNDTDFETIHAIINGGAAAYRGVIPADRWHEPYMSQEELRHEIDCDVRFWSSEGLSLSTSNLDTRTVSAVQTPEPGRRAVVTRPRLHPIH